MTNQVLIPPSERVSVRSLSAPQAVVAVLAVIFVSVAITAVWNPIWFMNRALDLYLQGRGAHQHTIDVGEDRIHYWDLPAEGRQIGTIVLVHGLGASGASWAPMIPALSRAGYHVYAPDMLGYGHSSRPKNGDTSIPAEEESLRGFMDRLHLQSPDVAGWSMGGWVATDLAYHYPERVRRLVLFDAAGLWMPLDYPTSIFTAPDMAALRELLRRNEPDRPFVTLPAFAMPGMLRHMRFNAPAIRSTLASMLSGRELVDDRVPQLRMPVLIVWGAQDKLIPVNVGLRLHSLIPQSIFVSVEGCGHLAPAECSSVVLRPTLSFLNAETPLPPATLSLPGPRR